MITCNYHLTKCPIEYMPWKAGEKKRQQDSGVNRLPLVLPEYMVYLITLSIG